jgi:hypothetical protein
VFTLRQGVARRGEEKLLLPSWPLIERLIVATAIASSISPTHRVESLPVGSAKGLTLSGGDVSFADPSDPEGGAIRSAGCRPSGTMICSTASRDPAMNGWATIVSSSGTRCVAGKRHQASGAFSDVSGLGPALPQAGGERNAFATEGDHGIDREPRRNNCRAAGEGLE